MFQGIEGLYFFTATCLEWNPLLENEKHQKILLGSLTYLTSENICTIYGFVIMPNHVHLLLGIHPENKKEFQLRFLKYTSQKIIAILKKTNPELLNNIKSTQGDRIYHFWERRPKWIALVTSKIFYQKLRYIHNNPFKGKWKLCATPEEYRMSSARSYLNMNPEFDFLRLYSE